MSRGVSGKLAVDLSLAFPLVEYLNCHGFQLGHVRFVPWGPKLVAVISILERLWVQCRTESIRGFETRTSGGFKVTYFVAYSASRGVKSMRVVELWVEGIVDGGKCVILNLGQFSLEDLLLLQPASVQI